MDRATRVVALQRAYVDFPNVCQMLDKLIASNFAELRELIDQQLASLEQATIQIDDWTVAKRDELEDSSRKLYERLVRLEQSLTNALGTMPRGRPN